MDKGEEQKRTIKTHEDLVIYQKAFEAAMIIFELSKQFPPEERYSLTDQIRRASRSVCTNFAPGMAYPLRVRQGRKVDLVDKEVIVFPPCLHSFLVFLVLSKEGEAAETQVWLKFAVKCDYISTEQGRELYSTYNQILSGLVKMINNPESWLIG